MFLRFKNQAAECKRIYLSVIAKLLQEGIPTCETKQKLSRRAHRVSDFFDTALAPSVLDCAVVS